MPKMLSSGDVSQMFAAQTAAFSQQAAYAQQIAPPTLAAWGTPSAWGRGQPAFPGMRPPSPPVSYAPSGFASASYGTGTQLAGGLMSGIGGLGTATGIGLGMAGMFGKLGGLASIGVDPIAGAMAGFGKMGLIGAGLGAMPALVIGELAAHGIGSFVQGGQQQQMLNTQLGQFGFQNQASRTGFGFSRDDAQVIGHQIRSLANLPALMTSVGELTALIPKLKASGVMQGVHDATEFNQRFKDSLKTIREVSKMMGTTLDEAADFFAHSRGVGFLGRQAQLQNVMNAQFTTAVTGMSSQQFMQMQQSGASMGVQMGISRGRGARAVTNIAETLGVGLHSGRISEETLEDVTGLQGSEAVKAASERLAGVTSQLAKTTAAGRLVMFGSAKFDKQGRYVGIDEGARGLSVSELKARAGNLTRDQKIAAMAHIDTLSADFAGTMGPGRLAEVMENAMAERGYTTEDQQLMGMKKMFGEQGESTFALMQQMKGTGFDEQDRGQMAQRQARERALQESTDIGMMKKRLMTKVHKETFGKFEQFGSEVFTDIGKAWDSWVDDVVGRHIVTMSKEGSAKLARSFATNQGRKDLEEMFSLAAGVPATPQQASRGFGATMGRAGLMGLMGPLAAPMAISGAMGQIKDLARMFTGGGSVFNSTELSTGRTGEQQFNQMRKDMGFTGGTELEAEAGMRKQFAALQAFGREEGNLMGGATTRVRGETRGAAFGGTTQAAMRQIALEAVGRLNADRTYQDAEAGKKQELLGRELAATPQGIAAYQTMVRRGLVAQGTSMETALAQAYGGKEMEGALANAADAMGAVNLRDTEGQIKDAKSRLETLFDKGTATAIGDGSFAGALHQIMSSEGTLEQVAKTLREGTPEAKVAILKQYNVKGTDADSFGAVIAKVNAKYPRGKEKEARDAIDALRGATARGDVSIFQKRMMTAADEVKNEGLKKALLVFGSVKEDTKEGTKILAARDEISAQLAGIRSKMQAVARAGGPGAAEKLRQLREEAGGFGSALSAHLTMEGGDRQFARGSQDVAEIATHYGINPEDVVSSVGATAGAAKIQMNEGLLEKVKNKASVIHATHENMGGAEMSTGEMNKELLSVLKKIDAKLDKGNTIDDTANRDAAKDYAADVQRAVNETTSTNSSGKTTLGPTQ